MQVKYPGLSKDMAQIGSFKYANNEGTKIAAIVMDSEPVNRQFTLCCTVHLLQHTERFTSYNGKQIRNKQKQCKVQNTPQQLDHSLPQDKIFESPQHA